MESIGIAGSKWSVFIKGVTFLLGAFVGLAESWDRGIPACEVQAEQTSPLQNQILFLAPWMLPRWEVCETQGDLALHGNKVSLLSETCNICSSFAFPWAPRVTACCLLLLLWLSEQHLPADLLAEASTQLLFISWLKPCICGVVTVQNCSKADLSHVSSILGEGL